MAGRLTGKVAIVTGAGKGLGRQYALGLAREGAKVLVNDLGLTLWGDIRDQSIAQQAVDEIRAAGGEAVANGDTVATWEGAERVVHAAVEAFGGLDILINNAALARIKNLWKVDEEDWDAVLNVNLKGYFAMIKFAAPILCKQRSGVIVNISSGSGFGHPGNLMLGTAKEGVVGLTRSVARELGRFGVRCNALRPGAATETALFDYMEQSEKVNLLPLMAATMGGRTRQANAGRITDPSERGPNKVAPLMVWLCSDAAANVNGRSFHGAGDQVGLYSEPDPIRVFHKPGGWDLDSLDAIAGGLIGDLTNDYMLDDHPELQVFEE